MREPQIFAGHLKSYQLKGLNWLINLYEQGINGILADEMGLGKTIQAIAFMAYLAEAKGIWGPFLIVAPNSTLHQWEQEIAKFCPKLKVVPYWGSQADRRVMRRYWNPKHLYKHDSPFHVLVTSYQVAVNDSKAFHRLKWQYMVLDEAQALKNASSQRWQTLLQLRCRNRLLLTGTPIQNSMAELWALLHFIMPEFFDSHAEFNEWFSKDVQTHAAGDRSALDALQLRRLHMILKPFMLRRVKKDVENEMAPKIEIQVNCHLSERQKLLYRGTGPQRRATTAAGRSVTRCAARVGVMQG
jgi:DNA helicase INO80